MEAILNDSAWWVQGETIKVWVLKNPKHIRAHIVVQWVKLLPVTLTSHRSMCLSPAAFLSPNFSTLNPVPYCCAGESSRRWLQFLCSCRPHGKAGFRPNYCDCLKVNQWIFLCVFAYSCLCDDMFKVNKSF